MYSAVSLGPTGTGKSYAMISLAWLMDRDSNDEPRFESDRIIFSPADFMKHMEIDYPEGTFLIVDDAAIMLYSKDAMKTAVRKLGQTLITNRWKNLGILFTLPNLRMLESHARMLLKAKFTILGIDKERQQAISKYHYSQVNEDTGKIYWKREIVSFNWMHPKYEIPIRKQAKLNSIRIDKPPKELIKPYEKQKREYLLQFYKKARKELARLEDAKTGKSFTEIYKEVKEDIKTYLNEKGRADPSLIRLHYRKDPNIDEPLGINAAGQVASVLNTEINMGKIKVKKE